MSKNTRFAVFFVIIMAVVLVLLSPSKETIKKDEEIVSPAVETTKSASMKNVFEEKYMENCLESEEVNYSYCSCTYDFLLKEYGLSKMLKIAGEFETTGEASKELWEAVLTCYEFLE